MILSETSLVIGNGAAGITAHASTKALLSPLSGVSFPTTGTDGAILALIFDGLSYDIVGESTSLAVTAEFQELATPNSVVTVAATDEGVSDLVENRVSNRRVIVGCHNDSREADEATLVIAGAGALRGASEVDNPVLEPMLIHEGAGEFSDLSGVHGTMLTPTVIVVNCRNH